tara:strand:- start:369 stop:689 length:321 start_codon:yes stop_codon:yes gene_type:complete
MPNHKLVYSTDDSINLKEKDSMSELFHLEHKIRLHLERKKGGKTLTIIKGFNKREDELKLLAKDLKKKCATGGSVKNNEIIIQGNKREQIKSILEQKGYKSKFSGG